MVGVWAQAAVCLLYLVDPVCLVHRVAVLFTKLNGVQLRWTMVTIFDESLLAGFFSTLLGALEAGLQKRGS